MRNIECIGSADIVIAIDASGSIKEVDYYAVINFVSELVQEFNVDVSNTTNMVIDINNIIFFYCVHDIIVTYYHRER